MLVQLTRNWKAWRCGKILDVDAGKVEIWCHHKNPARRIAIEYVPPLENEQTPELTSVGTTVETMAHSGVDDSPPLRKHVLPKRNRAGNP